MASRSCRICAPPGWQDADGVVFMPPGYRNGTDMRKSLVDATILVAEDEIVSREMVARVLTRLAVTHVLRAKDGVEAPDLIEQAGGAIDTAIMDFNLPRLHGLQVLKRIRTDETAAPAGLLCTTGSDEARLLGLASASALGVGAFLPKARPPSTNSRLSWWGSSAGQRPEPRLMSTGRSALRG